LRYHVPILILMRRSRYQQQHEQRVVKVKQEKVEAVRKVSSLEVELSNIRDERLCCLCWEHERCVLFDPCGHMCICTACAHAEREDGSFVFPKCPMPMTNRAGTCNVVIQNRRECKLGGKSLVADEAVRVTTGIDADL
jgi:hypothetical protein